MKHSHLRRRGDRRLSGGVTRPGRPRGLRNCPEAHMAATRNHGLKRIVDGQLHAAGLPATLAYRNDISPADGGDELSDYWFD